MHIGPNSLSWEELRHEGEVERQWSYEHQPVCSTDVHELPLLHADGQPIHKYGFYHRLRTHEAWRVPVFHGRLPRLPHADAPPRERGCYAAFLMLLFRPHRRYQDVIHIALGKFS